jgi:hypothetical protein
MDFECWENHERDAEGHDLGLDPVGGARLSEKIMFRQKGRSGMPIRSKRGPRSPADCFKFLVKHDRFGELVSTFPDWALKPEQRSRV